MDMGSLTIVKKSILFCIDTMNGGGAEKLLLRYINLLLHEGKYRVTLYIIHNIGDLICDIPPCVETYIEDLMSASDRKEFQQKQFEVEIGFLEGLPIKFIAARKTGAYKIGWIHTDLYYNNWCKNLFPAGHQEPIYNMLDKIVCINEYCETMFRKAFPSLTEKTCVCNNILDFGMLDQSRQASIVQSSRFSICFVGRLTVEKHPDVAVQSIIDLINIGYEISLDVLGSGYLYNKLLTMIKECNMEEYIKLLGYVNNPYPIINHSDVHLSLSDVEGGPLTIAEAYYLGVPSISTHSGGSDCFGNNYGGVLFVEKNYSSVKEGLIQIIENKNNILTRLKAEIEPNRIRTDFGPSALFDLIESVP